MNSPYNTSNQLLKPAICRQAEDTKYIGNDPKQQFITSISSALGLTKLGIRLSTRFEELGHVADIENAICCQHLAVWLTSDVDPNKPLFWTNLGNSYSRRFNWWKDHTDFDRGLRYYDRAVSLALDSHPNKPAMLSNLGSLYLGQYKQRGEHSDFTKALDLLSKAFKLTPDGDDGKPVMLSNLSQLYQRRFERLGELTDLAKAIEHMNEAVLVASNEHNLKPVMLNSLAKSYQYQYERLDDPGALDKALYYSNQAVSLTPVKHSERSIVLRTLGLLYAARYERRGNLEDINSSIHYHAQTVPLIPKGDERKSGLLSALGNVYKSRYEHSGDLLDLDKAIDCQNQAVLLSPDSHKDKPLVLTSLGSTYGCRFRRLGEIADADAAVKCHRQALVLLPDNHQKRPGILTNFGISYLSRYDYLKEIQDLNKSIEYLGQAVSLTPEDSLDKPGILNHLGVAYTLRFMTSGEASDTNKAIDCQSQAVFLTPSDHAEMPRRLGNLGESYRCRLERRGDRSDADQAIDCMRRAAELTPNEHSRQPKRLTALGSCYRLRFKHFGDLKDIIEAIDCHRRAVSLIPDGHAEKPAALVEFGESLVSLGEYLFVPTAEMLFIAIGCFKAAVECTAGDPYTRLIAARKWADLRFLDKDSGHLAYQRIMELLPQLVWVGNTIEGRYKSITDLGDVATEAASFAISCGTYDRALEWLEEGRSIVWNQILQLRTPFEELCAVDSALANRLETIGRELEHAGSQSATLNPPTGEMPRLEQDAEHHRHLASEWESLLQKARAIDGFHDFMRPRTAKRLLHAATDGPVVIINVHSSRCDALILLPNSNDIGHVPLENFSFEKAVNARAELVSVIEQGGVRARGFKRINPAPGPEEKFKGMLAMLWSDAAQPVLNYLGYTRKLPVDELPHITWCTTGPLSLLPLHAAGGYNGSQPNLFDLVVSSYTPTLSALLAPSPQATNPHTGILAVGQEHTKGLGDLPNTVPELAAIKESANTTPYLQLDDSNATVGATLSAMRQYDWVHLACHATQLVGDPSRSAFHLYDGNLALATIAKQSFKNKGLAFLSACQTATGDEQLPDEAVHLAAGMMMAGYPSVIATMWSIHDEDAPEIAKHVYADLLKEGRMNHMRSARALHSAVAALRGKVGEESFERWVPFIHIGL